MARSLIRSSWTNCFCSDRFFFFAKTGRGHGSRIVALRASQSAGQVVRYVIMFRRCPMEVVCLEESNQRIVFSDCDFCTEIEPTVLSTSRFPMLFRGVITPSLMAAGPDAKHKLDLSSLSVVVVIVSAFLAALRDYILHWREGCFFLGGDFLRGPPHVLPNATLLPSRMRNRSRGRLGECRNMWTLPIIPRSPKLRFHDTSFETHNSEDHGDSGWTFT